MFIANVYGQFTATSTPLATLDAMMGHVVTKFPIMLNVHPSTRTGIVLSFWIEVVEGPWPSCQMWSGTRSMQADSAV